MGPVGLPSRDTGTLPCLGGGLSGVGRSVLPAVTARSCSAAAVAPGVVRDVTQRVLHPSINGERGKAGQANYAASKGGLNALARTAARELGRFGIRVNVVSPGWIESPMTGGLPAELRQRALEESVLGRLGQPEDVARAVLFLCSELSRHVTGQVLRVDGGQLIG